MFHFGADARRDTMAARRSKQALAAAALLLGLGAARAEAPDWHPDQCPRDLATAPREDDARIAWAICRDLDLLRSSIRWADGFFKRVGERRPESLQIEVRGQLERTVGALRQTRQALERVQLGARRSWRLQPGQWQFDLNGDGQVDTWERWFFALPRPNLEPAQLGMPRNDPAYFQTQFDASAKLRLDQADVLWALSYHQFIEGALTAVLAFELDFKQHELVLRQPERLQSAHALVGQGIRTSARMRDAVQAETHDEDEWIPAPAQTHTVFPLPIDAQAFATWGSVLEEMDALWQGRHLLPATRGARGPVGAIAPVCAPGQGLDLAVLLRSPPAAGTRYAFKTLPRDTERACRVVTAQRPLAALLPRAERRLQDATGMVALRYLYWVN